MNRLLIALILFCGTLHAAEIKLAPGVSLRASATGTVTTDASGNLVFTLDPASVITIIGNTPGPGPNPVPVPSGTLTDTVKLGTNAIPEYAAKAEHRRAMAFGMTFLAQATSAAPVADSRATVRQFCDSAVGTADSPKWKAWWTLVDTKLNQMQLTPATYTAALQEMAAALTADLPNSSAKDSAGQATYGLSPELIELLMKYLLPLLLKLLGLASLFKSCAGFA